MSSKSIFSNSYPRGSLWRIWDLHIHTPASFHWDGERFSDDEVKNTALVDEMIETMNDSDVEVFAIMDYWTFDGWKRLKKRLAEPGAPELKKTVFPGIELRICTPTNVRLNAHVIFSDEISEQHLDDFKAGLKLELINRPLSDSSLIEYAQKAGNDKLSKHGATRKELSSDNEKSLKVGCAIAEITRESYTSAIESVPEGMALGFMPFSTNDGLAEIDWEEHYAFVLSLFSFSPIFETRKEELWAAFSGVETDGNRAWIGNFQSALDNTPRLAVSGSDAHRFLSSGTGDDKRGYGHFPSGKKTWIKSNPTWNGLKQAIKEPENRSFIGAIPPKLEKVEQNKTFYIDSLSISKKSSAKHSGSWLDGCNLQFNQDLVAIIGNKGSGKSALADIIALLGQSKQNRHFSFLQKDRFRGKSGEPAKFFEGNLKWLAGPDGKRLLSDDTEPEQVELVRYIPQGRFEELCNDHVRGKSREFEEELRSVIFSHVPKSKLAGSSNFRELIERLEEQFRDDLAEHRKSLTSLNEEISVIERQLNPTVTKNAKEQLKLVEQQLSEHNLNKPSEEEEPADELTPEQSEAKSKILEIDEELERLDAKLTSASSLERRATSKLQTVQSLKSRFSRFGDQFRELTVASSADLQELHMSVERLVLFDLKTEYLDRRDARYRAFLQNLNSSRSEVEKSKSDFNQEKSRLSEKLAAPQRRYQLYLQSLKKWEEKLKSIEGTRDDPETRQGILARISYLEELPNTLKDRRGQRVELTKKIFLALEKQREIREELFAPLQKVIQGDSLIREEYQLNFHAKLDAGIDKFSSELFDLIKQTSGALRGEDRSLESVREVFERNDLTNSEGIVKLVVELDELLEDAARKSEADSFGLRAIMRKDRNEASVYDHIFGLKYIEPKYTLLFQETQIEQLSPGQRGALLLIFYLLVDDGRNPIVLDQPEENLDNQTIVSLLVPVLNKAKKNRQIFMVTHNPNLAVVCDAEQIIHASFDRKGGPSINYNAGAIEDSDVNQLVVDVLEGTKFAFDNRGQKYH